jgi:hypothetical protein
MGQYEPSSLARLPLILLQGADDFGLDRDELMRDAGLSQSDLDEPDSRVSLRRVWTLWRIATEKAGDPWLMLRVVASTRVRAYGLVGYTMTNSRTLRQALVRLARYSRIVTDAVRLRFNPEADGARMVVEGPVTDFDVPSSGPAVRHAFPLAAARELTGQQDSLAEVRFRTRLRRTRTTSPDAAGAARLRFARCPVAFSQAQTAGWWWAPT